MLQIELRPFERADFSRLIRWSCSAEFLIQWAGLGFSYPLDETQLERYFEKSGFIKEGLLRDMYPVGEDYWSVYVMSILEHEWRK